MIKKLKAIIYLYIKHINKSNNIYYRMPGKYWMYLKCIHYNKILDGMWYDELKRKIDLLEKNKIKINLSDQ